MHVDALVNRLGACSLAVADRLQEAAGADVAVGASGVAALIALDGYLDGATIDALGRVPGLSHSGAVRLVDRLAAAGLVERRAAQDGRAVAVHITPAGRAAATRALAARRVALADVLAALSPADRARLGPLLDRLLDRLTEDRAAARHLCRLCDIEACGHPDCPVTRAADRATAAADHPAADHPATAGPAADRARA